MPHHVFRALFIATPLEYRGDAPYIIRYCVTLQTCRYISYAVIRSVNDTSLFMRRYITRLLIPQQREIPGFPIYFLLD